MAFPLARRYNGGYTSIRIQRSNEGIDVRSYLDRLIGQVIIGSQSGIKAKIKSFITTSLNASWYVVFVRYLSTGGEDNEVFTSGESLLLDNEVVTTKGGTTFQPGEPIAQVVPSNAAFVGGAAVLSSGIYCELLKRAPQYM